MAVHIINHDRNAINCRDIPGLGFVLTPGITADLPNRIYNTLKKHPTLKMYMECGVLEVLRGDPMVQGQSQEFENAQGRKIKLNLQETKRRGEASPILTLEEQDKLFKRDIRPKKGMFDPGIQDDEDIVVSMVSEEDFNKVLAEIDNTTKVLYETETHKEKAPEATTEPEPKKKPRATKKKTPKAEVISDGQE